MKAGMYGEIVARVGNLSICSDGVIFAATGNTGADVSGGTP